LVCLLFSMHGFLDCYSSGSTFAYYSNGEPVYYSTDAFEYITMHLINEV
jgi:hypothetical protein